MNTHAYIVEFDATSENEASVVSQIGNEHGQPVMSSIYSNGASGCGKEQETDFCISVCSFTVLKITVVSLELLETRRRIKPRPYMLSSNDKLLRSKSHPMPSFTKLFTFAALVASGFSTSLPAVGEYSFTSLVDTLRSELMLYLYSRTRSMLWRDARQQHHDSRWWPRYSLHHPLLHCQLCVPKAISHQCLWRKL
jgi:hypothetical protein